MKRYLNTLFVATKGAYLSKDGETVLVRAGGKVLLRTPIHLLGGIVCFGEIKLSPRLMAHCADNQTAVSFLTENGRFLARVTGPISGNVLLRKEQYRRTGDPEFAAQIARSILAGKLANCRVALLRGARSGPEGERRERLLAAAGDLAALMEQLRQPLDLDRARGVEGLAAKRYFEVFDDLLSAQKRDFHFAGRSRRPPLDEINAMLSFVYTLLAHDVCAACEVVGLDPQAGFLHSDRPGRPSLALDLMEELRPVMADRLVISLINRKQIKASGFETSESGAVRMDDDTRKTILLNYQNRKQTEIRHPFLDEQVKLGRLCHVQALLLARHLRGDLDGYPPYFHR